MTFVMLMLGFPLITVIVSGIGALLTERLYAVPLSIATLYLILSFTVFNPSFLPWVLIYSALSLMTVLVIKRKEKVIK